MIKIIVAGLGAGEFDTLSFKVYDLLKSDIKKYFRTVKHPSVEEIKNQGVEFTALDSFYDEGKDFEETYSKMTEYLIDEANKNKEIAFFVPGNPALAENVVENLSKLSKEKGFEFEIIASLGFLESISALIMEKLGIDIGVGTVILDALDINLRDLNPSRNLLISQVYNNKIAGDLKLKLMERYDDEIDVFMIKGAGTKDEEFKKIKLFEMDYLENEYDHLSSLFIPKEKEARNDIYDLLDQVELLRKNCPWDKKQDFKSVTKYFKEESEELVKAIENDDPENIIEEMGDVLFELAFFASLGKEEFALDFLEVTDGVYKKMKRRHPHIYEGMNIEGIDMEELWQEIKKREK